MPGGVDVGGTAQGCQHRAIECRVTGADDQVPARRGTRAGQLHGRARVKKADAAAGIERRIGQPYRFGMDLAAGADHDVPGSLGAGLDRSVGQLHTIRGHRHVPPRRHGSRTPQAAAGHHHIAMGLDAARCQPQVAAARHHEVAGGCVSRTGVPYASALVRHHQFDAARHQAAGSRDVERDAIGRRGGRCAVGNPGREVVSGGNAGVDLGMAVTHHRADACVRIGIQVLHLAGDTQLLGDQLQVQQRAGQPAGANVDGALTRVQHKVALQLPIDREIVERDLSRGQRQVAHVPHHHAVDADAVGIGDHHVGAGAQHAELALQQGRIGAGDLVEDGACARGRVVEIDPGTRHVEFAIGIRGDAAHGASHANRDTAIGARDGRGGSATVRHNAGGQAMRGQRELAQPRDPSGGPTRQPGKNPPYSIQRPTPFFLILRRTFDEHSGFRGRKITKAGSASNSRSAKNARCVGGLQRCNLMQFRNF
ncbi:hypothetical protein D3C86_1290290 [compost metagenome]